MNELAILHKGMTEARREQAGSRLPIDRETQKKIAQEEKTRFLRNARWAKKNNRPAEVKTYIKAACIWHRRLQSLKWEK